MNGTGNIVAAGMNFDDITTSGIYRFNDQSSYTNPPPTSWGQLLVVHGAGDTIAQLAFPYNASSFFLRCGNPPSCGGFGSWTAWKEFS